MDTGGIRNGSGNLRGMSGNVSGGDIEDFAGDEPEDPSGGGTAVCDPGYRAWEDGGGGSVFFGGDGDVRPV